MNDKTKACRRWQWRPVALSATGMGLALLAAACGGSPGNSVQGSGQSPYQQALAYAQCMRSHGVSTFPDPNSQGAFSQLPPASSASFQSADRTCGHLLPVQPRSASQKRQDSSRALRFSACMRSHGVRNFPDPIIAPGGTSVGFRVGHVDMNSPQVQSAEEACRSLAPKFFGGPQ